MIRILTELNFHYSKPEVDQWIWEVDEDLDGSVNRYEFTLMYKRYRGKYAGVFSTRMVCSLGICSTWYSS